MKSVRRNALRMAAASVATGYNIGANRYRPIVDPSDPGASLTAAAINDNGDVAGFYTSPATGNTDGFLATP
jgi:hypothetical protein